MSARSEDFTQISAFDAGADDYISKPVKPKILMKKIASIVKRLNKQNDLKEELDLDEIKINRKDILQFIKMVNLSFYQEKSLNCFTY